MRVVSANGWVQTTTSYLIRTEQGAEIDKERTAFSRSAPKNLPKSVEGCQKVLRGVNLKGLRTDIGEPKGRGNILGNFR